MVELFLKLRHGIPTALGVGIVRGEHEQVRSSLLHHPADWLPWERCELEVAVDVLRWLGLQAVQWLLGSTKGALCVVEVMQPRDDPASSLLDAAASEPGEPVEQSVEDEGTQEEGRGIMDG